METALADGRQADESLVWKCSLGLAWVAMYRGDLAAARTATHVKAARNRQFTGGSERMVGPAAAWILGCIELSSGRAAEARDTLAPLIDVIRATPLYHLASLPLVVLAEAHRALGALDDAAASFDEATSLARSGALTWVLGRASLVRAKLRAREG